MVLIATVSTSWVVIVVLMASPFADGRKLNSLRCGFTNAASRIPGAFHAGDGRTDDQHPGPGVDHYRRRVLVDTPIDLKLSVEPAAVQLGANLRHLDDHLLPEALPAEAGTHGHAQDEVGLIQKGIDRLVGSLGIERHPGPKTKASRFCQQIARLADLHVDCAAVGPCLAERRQVITGIRHHQVAVEKETGMLP
jgi:hypothetical protein